MVPGNGFICLDVGGMCCHTSEVARAHGLVTWTSGRSADRTIVHGLVPDGVAEVVLTATEGTTKTVPVQDNVYGIEMEGVFTSLRFAGPRGPLSLGPGAEWTPARLPCGSGNEKKARNSLPPPLSSRDTPVAVNPISFGMAQRAQSWLGSRADQAVREPTACERAA